MLSALKKPAKHPVLAQKQAAVRKALTSWKKGSALLAAHELAWMFVAADEPKVARSIVDEIADNVVFANNYNVWLPAAEAIASAARFAREAKDTKRYKALMARLVETPPYAAGADADYFKDVIRRYTRQLEAAPTEKRAATGALYAANSVTTFVFFAETVRHGGFPYEKLFTTKQLEGLIDRCVAVLRAQLAK